MAETQFSRSGSVNPTLIPEKWSKSDYKQLYEINPLANYIGTSDNAIIQVDKNFIKEQGDKITFALRTLLVGDGQTDDGTYTGNAEAMTFYSNSVVLHEQGNSVALAGNMTEQSAYAKLRPKGRAAIREWVANVQTRGILDSLCGLSLTTLNGGIVSGVRAKDASANEIETVTKVAPVKGVTAPRCFIGGQDSAGAITEVATDSALLDAGDMEFGTSVISEVKRMAVATTNAAGVPISPVRPVMVGGEPWYVFFVSRLQLKALRADAAWLQAQREANLRGNTNPIFTGAEGIWDGVVIRVTDTLPRRLGAGGVTLAEGFETADDLVTNDALAATVASNRAVFCGAQAVNMAWGKMPVWKEGFNDPPHNTKWVTHTDWIYGIKKTIFNSIDFGCIVVDTVV